MTNTMRSTFTISSDFSLPDVKELVQNNRELVIGKFLYDKNIPAKAVLENHLVSLKERLDKENVIKLALTDKKGDIRGVTVIEKSKWDCKHFGFNVGKSRLILFDGDVDIFERQELVQEALKICVSNDFGLVIARINSQDLSTIHVFENEGAVNFGALTIFYIDLERRIIPTYELPDVEVGHAVESDTQVVELISKSAFRWDHFHLDNMLPRDKCDELFAKWSLNCLNGLSDTVLVARKNSKTVGFVTCKIERVSSDFSYGIIDLIAVSHSFKRQGIGLLLVTEALKWFSEYTLSVYVGTQAANISAVKTYEKSGFRPISNEITLHQWLRGQA